MTTNTTSQNLSRFVQDYHTNKWEQIRRVIPPAAPTPAPENYIPTNFVDTRPLDARRLSNLLRSAGIYPLIGVAMGSPMQRLHISSAISNLNDPRVTSLEDLALLSSEERHKLRNTAHDRTRAPVELVEPYDPDFSMPTQQEPSGFNFHVHAPGTVEEQEYDVDIAARRARAASLKRVLF
jgi:hypothetical protein